ncbi:hypothetical protein G7Y89_g11592 [Cudoniella acicularis]|uniref:N-acetylgalactosaminide beta-1,3-galactosyltransferase n=1 Tax=Cudoniella acicularis TaxID=354080 RepID=A0A8H4RAJ6_9HELO|nr:hypothetical protein G7Y89_g11592 [Cudoniella acicularis]
MFKFRSSIFRFLVVAVVLLAIVHFYISVPVEDTYQSTWDWRLESHNDDACSLFSGLERVVITVKTGATESLKRIPTQLQTSLRCAPHVYVFSDMAQMIGETQVYDALDTIPTEVTEGNSDFDIYRKQQELGDPAKVPSVLRDFKDPRNPEALAAWTLDKYKSLHVVEKAWALQPDMDWYFHIDADTYVIWSSLISWIQRLDAQKESFIGSLSYIVGKPFAHGGSGLLLSNAATRNLVVTHNGTAASWDYKMHENCCGDWVLAQVLNDYGIKLMNSWPTLNGETPDTIPFASDHWCQPVVTLHHITPTEAERFGKFEQRRENKSAPVLYAEIFKDLLFDTIPDELADWDNMAKDEAVSNITSVEGCIEACANNSDCFQSLYTGDECSLGTKNFRFGEKHAPEGNKKWQSSWNRTRIAAWVSKQTPCNSVAFPFQE